MSVRNHITLLIYQIDCITSSGESGHDDIFFEVYADGSNTTYYHSNPIKVLDGDTRAVNLDIDVTYLSSLYVEVWDKDKSSSNDRMGTAYFYRGDPLRSTKSISRSGHPAEYKLYYRVLNKPIPTLRVMGTICHAQSSNCNDELLSKVTGVAEEICEDAAKVMKKSPRPRAKLISKGFKTASNIIDNCEEVVQWILKMCEGKDDVYMQQLLDSHDGSGGGFFPSTTSGERTCHMEKDDEVYFDSGQWLINNHAHYYRIALDDGDSGKIKETTIQLREHDPASPDIPMGHITIDAAKYNKLCDQGAQVELMDDYFRHQTQEGQGALYSICYSVGLEDWAKDATEAAQATTGGIAEGYVVVYDGHIAGTFGDDLEGAVKKLNSFAHNHTSRCIVKVDKGTALDPTTIRYNGYSQNAGLPTFNKFWADWNDIHHMQKIAAPWKFVVVFGSDVVAVYDNVEAAFYKLNSYYYGDTTSRAVFQIFSEEAGDPHDVQYGSYNQGQSSPYYGFNKRWSNWDDIHRMQAIAKPHPGRWLVVHGDQVVGKHEYPIDARNTLLMYPRDGVSRAVFDMGSGKAGDPHQVTLEGHSQGGDASYWNKHWANWDDIHRMQGIVNASV